MQKVHAAVPGWDCFEKGLIVVGIEWVLTTCMHIGH